MKHYNENKQSSYLRYCDINNLFGWAMSQKLPVNSFKWVEDLSEFGEGFKKSYYEKSQERYFIEADIQYSKVLHELHNDLSFLPRGWKLEKLKNILATLHDKNEYVFRIRNLKQALNHGLVLKKKS